VPLCGCEEAVEIFDEGGIFGVEDAGAFECEDRVVELASALGGGRNRPERHHLLARIVPEFESCFSDAKRVGVSSLGVMETSKLVGNANVDEARGRRATMGPFEHLDDPCRLRTRTKMGQRGIELETSSSLTTLLQARLRLEKTGKLGVIASPNGVVDECRADRTYSRRQFERSNERRTCGPRIRELVIEHQRAFDMKPGRDVRIGGKFREARVKIREVGPSLGL
jgi:hypothetical protein